MVDGDYSTDLNKNYSGILTDAEINIIDKQGLLLKYTDRSQLNATYDI